MTLYKFLTDAKALLEGFYEPGDEIEIKYNASRYMTSYLKCDEALNGGALSPLRDKEVITFHNVLDTLEIYVVD